MPFTSEEIEISMGLTKAHEIAIEKLDAAHKVLAYVVADLVEKDLGGRKYLQILREHFTGQLVTGTKEGVRSTRLDEFVDLIEENLAEA